MVNSQPSARRLPCLRHSGARMCTPIHTLLYALLTIMLLLLLLTPLSAVQAATTSYTNKRQTVLVTGGAGFIGSNVAQFLIARGDNVVVVDEVNDYYNISIKEGNLALLDNDATIYRGDICDTNLMEMIFQTHSIDVVCHMAARAGVRPSIQNPFVYVHSNVRGTVTLMELAVKYKVSNFVFASSSSVYGGSNSTYFSETEQVDRPISPYAATKKACELFAHFYAVNYNLPVTALRFFTVYGPRGRPDMAPFKFIDRVSRGAAIQQFGTGSSSRDYTYVDDIVQGVVAAVDRPQPYKIYNLGKGSGTALSDFIHLVETYVGKSAKIEVLPDQPGDVPYTCANVSQAIEQLDYQATVPFEEGIRRTVEWYKQAHGDDEAAMKSVAKRVRRTLLETQADFLEMTDEYFDFASTMPQQRRRELARNAVVPHTKPKKVLVTGGAGVLGVRVVEDLLVRGDSVVVLDLRESTDLQALQDTFPKQLVTFEGDICDSELVGRIFADEAPAWVVHLAAQTSETASILDPVATIRSNVEGTLRLLESSKDASIVNFVVASSSAVYTDGFFSENDRVDRPLSPMAASKKAAELLAYTYHHLYRLPVTVLRIFEASTNQALSAENAVEGILLSLDRPFRYQIYNLAASHGEKAAKLLEFKGEAMSRSGDSEKEEIDESLDSLRTSMKRAQSVNMAEGLSLSSFPSWLRSLAFFQWLLVLSIVAARAYFRVSASHSTSRPTSPTTTEHASV